MSRSSTSSKNVATACGRGPVTGPPPPPRSRTGCRPAPGCVVRAARRRVPDGPGVAHRPERSTVPSNTCATGPPSRHLAVGIAARRRGRRRGTCTVTTRRPPMPASFAATATAHAPVPHASVSPAPRSHTRTSMRPQPPARTPRSCARGTTRDARARARCAPRGSAPDPPARTGPDAGCPSTPRSPSPLSPPPRSNGWSRNVSHAGPFIGICAFVKPGFAHRHGRAHAPIVRAPSRSIRRGPAGVDDLEPDRPRQTTGVAGMRPGTAGRCPRSRRETVRVRQLEREAGPRERA